MLRYVGDLVAQFQMAWHQRVRWSGEDEALDWLAGEFSDEFEVFVEMQDDQLCEFGRRGDQQIGNGWSAVLSASGE